MSSPAADTARDTTRLAIFAVLVVGVVASGVVLKALAGILVPFALAVLFGYMLRPAVDMLQVRLKVPRAIAVVLTFLVAAIAIFLIVGLIAQSVGGLEDKADLYKDRLIELTQRFGDWLEGAGVSVTGADLTAELEKLPIGEMARDAVGGAVNALSNAVLALLFTIYLVSEGQPGVRAGGIWETVESTIRSYVATKLVTSAATGILTWGILTAFGVSLAVVFGILTFLLNFIPSVGSLIAIVLPIPIAVVGSDSMSAMLAMIIILVVVQNVIGNWLEPKMMGRGLDLHPVTILVALGVWGWLWGIVGMLLAAPLTAILRCVLAGNPLTWELSELLSGRIKPAEA